jgi:osmotically-inducible protein OsmY
MRFEDFRTLGRSGRTDRDTDPRYDVRGEGFDRRGWRRGSDYYGAYGSPWRDVAARSSQQAEYSGGRAGIFNNYGESRSHRGRGPKGYRRSDERILEDVCEGLSEDNDVDASDIEVSVEDCVVTLSGSVHSREEKRRAENVIAGLQGVQDVRNELRVIQAVMS